MSDAFRVLLGFLREPVRGGAVLVTLLLLGGLGFLPQFAGPGYEAALVAGVVLPSTAAIATALEVSRRRLSASSAVALGAAAGVGLATLGFVVVLLHGARVGFCDPSEGLYLYALGPGFGAVLGGCTGALAGLASAALVGRRPQLPRRALSVVLALLGPVIGIVVSVGRFLTSPMVFAFDPYFGVFAGPLYDTVVSVVDRMITYRWGTSLTLVALVAGARVATLAAASTVRDAVRQSPGTAVLSVCAALGSLLHVSEGPRYGHWNTPASIAEALGGRHEGKRCDIIFARSIPLRDVRLFARDCDASVPVVEAYFGARGPERIRVYLFANDAEKGWLMGASRTYIAKPWRGEVYVQLLPYPHPVIAHELAHVVAGSFARGPFRVAGHFGGLWPDPGRIEGFAVAAAPDETDELTEQEWAASMLALGILPPLSQVFELDFLSLTASKAYTVAGAFVDYVRETYGAEAIRRWYAGEELAAVTRGKDLRQLERDFRAMLGKLTVPARALATAKARFDQPAFFARKCPRIVDRSLGEANARLASGDVAGAAEAYRQALSLDAANVDARFGLAGCARRAGRDGEARERYLELARATEVPKTLSIRALESAADGELQRGRASEAAQLYRQALALVFDEDRKRTLEVKLLASEGSGREAIVALLIGDPELGPGFDLAAPLIQAWSHADPAHDVPPYLIGRNLLGAGRWADGSKYLDASLALSTKLPSVRREALRLRLIASCALQDHARARAVLQTALTDPELPRARAAGLTRLAERCGAVPPAAHHPASGTVPPPAGSGLAAVAASAPAPAPLPPASCPTSMVPIPGGRFWVGSDPKEGFSDDESPRYLTELAPFCMDETEVTAAAYAECVRAGSCRATEAKHVLCNFGRSGREQHPMNCIDHAAAEKFCATRDARLPREAEFEYVARGGERALDYPWGNESPDGRACWKHNGTCEVKRFAAGAFGLYDVSGNVWEWTSDWYGAYPWPPETGFAKVYRGGSFSRRFEKWMHTRLRERSKPSEGGPHLGFRCVKTLDPAHCPFGVESPGLCRHGVIERTCPEGKTWNGVRCAAAGEPRCLSGWAERAGHGCVLEHAAEAVVEDVEELAKSVTRARSPEHDADCRKNSRDRPHSFRYAGGSHAARNLVSRRSGCKNRDVGVGWNSTCCP